MGLIHLMNDFCCQSTTPLDKAAANNANEHELESKVFIGITWACEGIKAAKSRRCPFQSCYWRALAA